MRRTLALVGIAGLLWVVILWAAFPKIFTTHHVAPPIVGAMEMIFRYQHLSGQMNLRPGDLPIAVLTLSSFTCMPSSLSRRNPRT